MTSSKLLSPSLILVRRKGTEDAEKMTDTTKVQDQQQSEVPPSAG
jgi:hypothetical protein